MLVEPAERPRHLAARQREAATEGSFGRECVCQHCRLAAEGASALNETPLGLVVRDEATGAGLEWAIEALTLQGRGRTREGAELRCPHPQVGAGGKRLVGIGAAQVVGAPTPRPDGADSVLACDLTRGCRFQADELQPFAATQ